MSRVFLITLPSIHQDLKGDCGAEEEGGKWTDGREKGTGGEEVFGVGVCRRIIKHRFGTLIKTATRRQRRGLWVGQPAAFC